MSRQDPHGWMYRDLKARVWRSFRKMDSDLLEYALANGEKQVLVEYGRHVVDLADRSMRAMYWHSEPCPVVRVLWLKCMPGMNFAPFEEEESERIEAFFQSRRFNEPLPLSDGKHCVVIHRPEGVTEEQVRHVLALGCASW